MLKASSAKIEQSKAKVQEAESNRLATLKFQGGYTRLSSVPDQAFDNPFQPGSKIKIADAILDNTQFNLTATQVLYAGGRLDGARDLAQLSTEAAQYDFKNDKLSTAYNARLAYWSLYRAQELKKSLDESVKQLEARVKDAEVLLKGGMITNNDVLKLQVQLSNLTVQRLDVESQIRSAMVALNNLMGMPLTSQYDLSSQPTDSDKESGDLNAMIGKAQQSRPDIVASEYRVRAAEKGIDVAAGGWYPQIAVNASYLLANPNQRIFPQRTQFDGTWQVGVNLSWDVWNWQLTSHQTAQAESQLIQAREGMGAMKDGIAVEVSQNYLSLAPSKERIGVAQTAIKQAEENYSVTSNRYKAGTATSTDVIEAETLLLQSKINRITAIVDYELAYARLKKSLGE